MLKVGEAAPNFTLPDQDGVLVSLESFKGQWVLLYFYPKDDTPGCTTEACTLRDRYATYQEKGVVILGVSTDSVKSHKKFSEKHSLPFRLLADTEKIVVAAYDVWKPKKFMGREYLGTMRQSYLINPNGQIAAQFEKVDPALHAEEVLKEVKNGLTRSN